MLILELGSVLRAGEVTPPTPPANEQPNGSESFDPAALMEKLRAERKVDQFAFIVLGDTKHSKSFSGKVVPYIADTLKPDFVLTTGDMVEYGGGPNGADFWSRLSKEAGADMRRRPWWPAIGNHELAARHILNKKDEQGVPQGILDGAAAFKKFYSLKETYYSFTFRNACFIALPWPAPKGESMTWLEAELKKAKDARQHIFCFNHRPFYTVGSKSLGEVPGKPNNVTELFGKYGVLAMFSGHDHIYYRTVRDGIPYVISAGGGASIYELKRRAEALPEDVFYGQSGKDYLYVNAAKKVERKSAKAEQFVCVLNVDGKSVKMKTLAVPSGEVWDELELAK